MPKGKSAPSPERHFERGGRANETTSNDLNPAGGDSQAATPGRLLVGGDHDPSLAFFRWRRLISPSIAEVTNCPVLSPSSFKLSIASTKPSGTRASILFDLAFTDFVAIAGLRNV